MKIGLRGDLPSAALPGSGEVAWPARAMTVKNVASSAGLLASQPFCGARRIRALFALPRLSVPRKLPAAAQAVETSWETGGPGACRLDTRLGGGDPGHRPHRCRLGPVRRDAGHHALSSRTAWAERCPGYAMSRSGRRAGRPAGPMVPAPTAVTALTRDCGRPDQDLRLSPPTGGPCIRTAGNPGAAAHAARSRSPTALAGRPAGPALVLPDRDSRFHMCQ